MTRCYHSDVCGAFVFALCFAGLVSYALSEAISPHHYGSIGAASGVLFFFMRLKCIERPDDATADALRAAAESSHSDDDEDQVLAPIIAAKGDDPVDVV